MADETNGFLPGFEAEESKVFQIGPVETGIKQQIDRLTADGWVTDHHAGQVALAIRAARDVDESAGKGAPSGRANLLRAMKEILEMLPQPEASTDGEFNQLLAAVLEQDAPA